MRKFQSCESVQPVDSLVNPKTQTCAFCIVGIWISTYSARLGCGLFILLFSGLSIFSWLCPAAFPPDLSFSDIHAGNARCLSWGRSWQFHNSCPLFNGFPGQVSIRFFQLENGFLSGNSTNVHPSHQIFHVGAHLLVLFFLGFGRSRPVGFFRGWKGAGKIVSSYLQHTWTQPLGIASFLLFALHTN